MVPFLAAGTLPKMNLGSLHHGVGTTMYIVFIRRTLVLACALFLSAATLTAQDAPRAMTVVDLIDLPSLGDPRISPDGSQVLFTRSETDWAGNRSLGHIWRIDADGTDEIQLTRGEDGESSPRWSPDGSRIAFLAERSEDAPRQIYILRNLGGEAEALTEHATSVMQIQWSPDGAWIYFGAHDDKTDEQKAAEKAEDDVFAYAENFQQVHLWRVDVATGEEQRITEGDYSIRGYTLSRDGSMIAHHRSVSPLYGDADQGEVWVMAADGSAAIQLTDNGVTEGGAELSPDNRWVLFTAGARADLGESYYNTNLFVVPAAGGEIRELAPASGFGLDQATWSADGSQIFVLANTGVRDGLYRVSVRDGSLAEIDTGDAALGGWSYSPGLGRHVFTRRTSTSPGDVHVLGEGGRATQVTHVFDDLGTRFRLPREEAIQWQGEDGVTVEGLLYYPLDYREGQRFPLVVQTHGGPSSSDQFGGLFSSSNYVPVLTSLGYFVLKPNYRGSTGYGDDFMRDMVGSYFNQSHLDVMTGVDHVIEMGLVDGERMAKMGWSAGGHMTNKIVTFTDRFKAASSGAGAANWISMYAQSDVRTYRTPWFGGTPWEKDAPTDLYWDSSPLKYVSNVTTPTLFLVGQQDLRVPMPQSVEMWRGVKNQGVPTHLYVAPREPHGWQELRHRLFKANVELDWFQRWVMSQTWIWEKAPGEEAAAKTIS
ncbi:MAG TPA: S9 family peptidase [Longimicrobiales bacterium]|nr:S9 family peptidase [Longimicrobiales bacterium]